MGTGLRLRTAVGMGAGLGITVGMAYVSAAKPITAEVMRAPAAARVISPSAAAESSAATSATAPCESPAAEAERCGSSGERDSEDHNSDTGDRSSPGQFNQRVVDGWGSFTSTIFIRTAFFGIWTAKRALGIVPGNFQSEITAAYCGRPGVVR
jgi:hypothetical protein